MTTGVLMAVFAHPDDESLLVGGTLAAAASAGMRVVIVTATRGEAGLPGNHARETRLNELERARHALSAHAVVCLNLPDGAVSDDVTKLSRALADEYARWSPDVILTFAEDGWYWHADHVAVHDAVAGAVATLPPATSVYTTTWPEHWMTRFVGAARARGAAAGAWGLPTEAFGSTADAIDVVVDVSRFLDRKLQAIRSHESQMELGSAFVDPPPDLACRYLGIEFLSVARAGTIDLPAELGVAGVTYRTRVGRRTKGSPVTATRGPSR